MEDFQSLFEYAPGLYLVLMPDLTIAAASEAYLRATMTRRDEIMNRGVFDVFPDNPDDPTSTSTQSLRISLNKVIRTLQPDTMAVLQYDIPRPESEGGGFEERHWSPLNSPVLNVDGSLRYIIHKVEDVTEFVQLKRQGLDQKRESEALRIKAEKMETELFFHSREVADINNKLSRANDELQILYERSRAVGRETQELLAAIVESSEDAILSKSLDGIISFWNLGAERLFGYSAAEAVGQHISFIIPPERLVEEDHIGSQLRAGKHIEHYETQRRAKDGRDLNISLTVSPIRNAAGEVIGASKILRDVTRHKDAEEGLLRYMQALERSNRELDDFAYIASHDLKEPLRGIHNHARFLLEDNADKLDKDSTERLNRLVYLSQRMEKLINDLLYFSRLGRQELAIQPTDLNEVVDDIGHMLQSFLEERHARILLPRKLPILVCDKTRVTEVLRNLITNAVKYNDAPEKTVEVGWQENGGVPAAPTLFVKDNGIGIAPEFHDEIFRIFRRLHRSDDSAEEGTGVGLTFVKKIIERHGGRIWLESTPGEGSCFYFTLENQNDLQAAA